MDKISREMLKPQVENDLIYNQERELEAEHKKELSFEEKINNCQDENGEQLLNAYPEITKLIEEHLLWVKETINNAREETDKKSFNRNLKRACEILSRDYNAKHNIMKNGEDRLKPAMVAAIYKTLEKKRTLH